MRLFTLSFLLVGSLAFAADCKLNHPIDLKGLDPLKNVILLEKAVFDQIPQFVRPENYDPKTDTLTVVLQNIELNRNPTNYVGATVGVEGKLEKVGFSGMYQGDFNFGGAQKIDQGNTLYRTVETYQPTGSHHAAGQAVTELILKISREGIVSLALKLPVYKVAKKYVSGDLVGFTGQHQTLCLQDAELRAR